MLSRLHRNPICQVWNRASGSREVKNVDVYMPMAIAQTDDLKTQVNMFSIFSSFVDLRPATIPSKLSSIQNYKKKHFLLFVFVWVQAEN